MAALVEVMRVLSAPDVRTGIRNDVILLITDAEEMGLLGAVGLVKERDWPKDVGVVLNFDARGTSGPSVMYETSRGNGGLIRRYAKWAAHPTASSLSDAVYQLMPNDSDFTILKAPSPLTRPKGWRDQTPEQAPNIPPGLQASVPHVPGMNFAFIGEYWNYHSERDNLENLSIASMRHHGLHALSLAKHFAEEDLEVLKRPAEDFIYFDLLNSVVVRYPMSWARPLAGIGTVAAGAVIGIGVGRKRIRAWRVVVALSAVLLVVVASVICAWAVGAVLGERMDRQADWAVAGLSLLAGSVAMGSWRVYRRWVGRREMVAGVLTGAAGLAILSAVYFPGGSYLLLGPMATLTVTLGILVALSGNAPMTTRRVAALLLAAVPTLLLLPVPIYLAFLGMRVGGMAPVLGEWGVRMGALMTALPAMGWMVLAGQWSVISAGKRGWVAAVAMLGGALGCFVICRM